MPDEPPGPDVDAVASRARVVDWLAALRSVPPLLLRSPHASVDPTAASQLRDFVGIDDDLDVEDDEVDEDEEGEGEREGEREREAEEKGGGAVGGRGDGLEDDENDRSFLAPDVSSARPPVRIGDAFAQPADGDQEVSALQSARRPQSRVQQQVRAFSRGIDCLDGVAPLPAGANAPRNAPSQPSKTGRQLQSDVEPDMRAELQLPAAQNARQQPDLSSLRWMLTSPLDEKQRQEQSMINRNIQSQRRATELDPAPTGWPAWAHRLVSRVTHLPLEERDRVADVVRAVVRVALLVGVPGPPALDGSDHAEKHDSTSPSSSVARLAKEASDKLSIDYRAPQDNRSTVMDPAASSMSHAGDVAHDVFLTLRDTLASLRIHVAAAADAARILDDEKYSRSTTQTCTRDEYGDLVAKSRNAREACAAVDVADAAVAASFTLLTKASRDRSAGVISVTGVGSANVNSISGSREVSGVSVVQGNASCTKFNRTDAQAFRPSPRATREHSEQRSSEQQLGRDKLPRRLRRPRACARPLSPCASVASSWDVPSSESNVIASCPLFQELRENRIYDWMGADDLPQVPDEIPLEPRSSSSSSVPSGRNCFRKREQRVAHSSSRATLSSDGFVRVDSGIVNDVPNADSRGFSDSNEPDAVTSPAPISEPITPVQFPPPQALHAVGSPSNSTEFLSSIASVHPPPSYPPPPDHLSAPLSGRSSIPASPPQPSQHSTSRVSGIVSNVAPTTTSLSLQLETPSYPMMLTQRTFHPRSNKHSHHLASGGFGSRTSARRSGSLAADRSSSTGPKLPLMPHGLSLVGRVPSSKNVLSSSPSIDRLAPDHFARTVSVGFLSRNESVHSQAPTPAPYNPAAALRVTFISVNSYGNTETSCDPDDVAYAAVGGGLLGASYGTGPSPSFARRNSFKSGANGGSQSRLTQAGCSVAEAAGSLYREGSIDKRWFFGQMVGEGAFSEVRLGEGRKGGGRVAIKVISKGAPDLFGPGGVCREVLAFQTIGKHPNIVECIEVFEDDRFVYIVLELLTGGLLLGRIADAEQYYPHYDERSSAHVIRSMVSALAYCHAIGVAHRDVKPENVLFVCEGMDECIKLTDFGIAHCSDSPCTDMSGTPLYVAPEVLLRKPYGCAADMWSVGVIAHILLVGYPPFDDDNILQLINKVKFKPVRLHGPEWKMVSDQARDFVARLLVKDPTGRMTAAEAQQHPWMTLTPLQENTRVREWPSLEAAQRNIQEFVMHREFKRVIQHENAESALKLAMLVSMSEKSLGDGDVGAEQFTKVSKDGTAYRHSSETRGQRDAIGVDESCKNGAGRFPVGYRASSRKYGPNGQKIPDSPATYSNVPGSDDTDAADRALQEQAELRQRRLLYLEEKRMRSQLSEGTDEGTSSGSKHRRSKREPSHDFLELEEFDTSETQTPTLPDAFDPFDTSPDLSAYAIKLQGTFSKERRNADADADWVRLRHRSDRDDVKAGPGYPPSKQPRKNLLWRRPPLFGGFTGGKSKLEAKNILSL